MNTADAIDGALCNIRAIAKVIIHSAELPSDLREEIATMGFIVLDQIEALDAAIIRSDAEQDARLAAAVAKAVEGAR